MSPRLCLLLLLILSALVPASLASSHGEAPAQVNNPTADAADVWAFSSYEAGRSAYVTFLVTYSGRARGTDGPNFHPLDDKFFYDINIDVTGDGIPETVYQFNPNNEFASPPNGVELNISGKLQPVALKALAPITAGNEAGLNALEYYTLSVTQNGVSALASKVGSNVTAFRKPFDYAGHKTFPNYTSYANQFIYDINLPSCSTPARVFVGQRAEAFVINIAPIFDLINFIPIDPSEFPGGIANNAANNDVGLSNNCLLALEVPKTCLGLTGNNTVIGVWTTSRPKRNTLSQRSRLGNPLINELLIGLPDKDKWSRRSPAQDGQLNNFIAYPTFPEIISILFKAAVNAQLGTTFTTLAPTNFPRQDLVAILLTGIPGLNKLIAPGKLIEMMRLNTATPVTPAASQNSIGVFGGDAAGYPNGRRPIDDVVDITLRAVMGKACYLGLGVCTPKDAPLGNLSYTDGAPITIDLFQQVFPYFQIPNTNS